ncbi:unnamed protein product [Oppiella nova]|uniref:Polyprenyl synthetase family protein n=1 Tax=Oppiella nova TaxID=334625 RepID=A0A7R9Q8L8_9ACAR|nr:unnamed protein product [Oppiella nova]CAG2157734.1 unnamed protein product [Oppiella nova]
MTIDFKQDILAPVATDFAAMDKFINEGITSKVALVMAVSKHVVEAGGKRMRPIMCLLAAKACGATDLQMDPYRKLAAIIEMLHTATLVHDDVVDESGLRRGRPTANATWNNQTAVLVGDFLISRAFDLLVDLDNMILLKDFSTGTCEIAEGEVLQLQAQHQPETTEQTYLDIIHGKPTLPLISALANTQGEEHEIIRKSIATGGTSDLDRVIEIVQSSVAVPQKKLKLRFKL